MSKLILFCLLFACTVSATLNETMFDEEHYVDQINKTYIKTEHEDFHFLTVNIFLLIYLIMLIMLLHFRPPNNDNEPHIPYMYMVLPFYMIVFIILLFVLMFIPPHWIYNRELEKPEIFAPDV